MEPSDAPADRARTYLRAFLPADRAAELSAAAQRDAADPDDLEAVLSAAHRRLIDEVRVTEEVCGEALVDDVGLSPTQAGRVVGIPPEEVEVAVEEAALVAAELGVPPPGAPRGRPAVDYVFDAEDPPLREEVAIPEPPPEHRARPGRTVTVIVAGLVLLALAVAVGTSLRTDGAEADGEAPGAGSALAVTAAGAALPAEDGGPGPTTEVFSPDDEVVLWFEYTPVDGEVHVELVLSRDGQELIAPSFPLPENRTDTHVTLPRVVTEQPGDYRVELRHDGRTLTEVSFRVRAE